MIMPVIGNRRIHLRLFVKPVSTVHPPYAALSCTFVPTRLFPVPNSPHVVGHLGNISKLLLSLVPVVTTPLSCSAARAVRQDAHLQKILQKQCSSIRRSTTRALSRKAVEEIQDPEMPLVRNVSRASKAEGTAEIDAEDRKMNDGAWCTTWIRAGGTVAAEHAGQGTAELL